MIWCRSWARAVRLVSVSAGRRVHSPRSATSCSCWVMAAIVDVTGCCPVSSNAVVIQGILASTTDSPGPGMRHFRQLWRSISKVFWSRQRCGLDTRSLALAARPPDSCSTSSTSVMPNPGADRHPAPYPSPSLRISTTHHPQPRRTGLDTLAPAARPPDSGRASSSPPGPLDAVSSTRQIRLGAPATANEGGLTSKTCQRPSTNASQPSSRRFSRTPRNCRRCRGSTSRR